MRLRAVNSGFGSFRQKDEFVLPINSQELVVYLRHREEEKRTQAIDLTTTPVYKNLMFRVRSLLPEAKMDESTKRGLAKQELHELLKDLSEGKYGCCEEGEIPFASEAAEKLLKLQAKFLNCGIKVEKQLAKLYRKETSETKKTNILKLLLMLNSDSGAPWFIVDKFQEGRKDSNYNFFVNFLKSLKPNYLASFLYATVKICSLSKADNLARALLEVANGHPLLEMILENAVQAKHNEFMPDEERKDFLDNSEGLYMSLLEQMSPPELQLKDLKKAYRAAESFLERIKVGDLILKHFPDEAADVFWKIANSKPGKSFDVKSLRFDALKRYMGLAKEVAVPDLKIFIENEKDPFMICTACELLGNNSICGETGRKALVDLVVEDIRNGNPSSVLASVACLPQNKHEVLEAIFSIPHDDFEKVFLNTESVYVCDVNGFETKAKIRITKLDMQNIIKMLDLARLIKWMNSPNAILRENATKVFELVSDENIQEFLALKNPEGELLKKLTGIEVPESTENVFLLDGIRYRDLIDRIQKLSPLARVNQKLEGDTLIKAQENIREALQKTTADLLEDETQMILEIDSFKQVCELRGLDLRDELVKLYNKADEREVGRKTVILKMLLTLGDDRSDFITQALTRMDKPRDLFIDFLKKLENDKLTEFISTMSDHFCFDWAETYQLANSLLQIKSGKGILGILLQRRKYLYDEYDLSPKEKRIIADNLEMLILSVMERMPSEDLELDCISKFYKRATENKVIEGTAELLVERFGVEAAPTFLEVFRDDRGITIDEIDGKQSNKVLRNRARRFEALNYYAYLTRENATGELKDLLIMGEEDPMLVQFACGVLSDKNRCGEKGNEAVIEVIRENIMNDEPSLLLACLAWGIADKDVEKDYDELLKRIFSMDIENFYEALVNMEALWLPEINESNGEIEPGVWQADTEKLIKSIGLARLVEWMSSDNLILQRNAMQAFNLASDKDIVEFLSTPSQEAELLKEHTDRDEYARELDFSLN